MSDPFEVLGVEPRFDLDLPAVEARHRELSRALHPDRHLGRPTAERRRALSRAIEVNDALRVLKDPVRRAEALLRRRGVVERESEQPRAASAFLMDVLELREELARIGRQADRGALRDLERVLAEREGAAQGDLGRALTELGDESTTPPSREAVEQIAHKLGELRYFRRLLDEARSIEDELG